MNPKIVFVVAGLSIAGGTLSFAADDVPRPASFGRYQAMLDRSPFAVATAVAAPAATPNFAKDLYIANAARSPDGDLVTLASSADKNFKKYLTTKAPLDGFSISNIEWSEKVGATKVTIAKDGQFATLTFNQALLSQPVALAAPGMPLPQQQSVVTPQPMPGQGGIAVPNAAGIAQPPYNLPKPMPVPSLPTPPPRVRGVIPRNLTSPAPNQSPQPDLG